MGTRVDRELDPSVRLRLNLERRGLAHTMGTGRGRGAGAMQDPPATVVAPARVEAGLPAPIARAVSHGVRWRRPSRKCLPRWDVLNDGRNPSVVQLALEAVSVAQRVDLDRDRAIPVPDHGPRSA